MVSALITVAAIAWCLQLALGGWQISRFNRAFDQLCQRGRVGVGRSGGRFKPRVVVAIALDEQQRGYRFVIYERSYCICQAR